MHDRPSDVPAPERIGAVVVTYNSAEVIGPCLDSLLRSEGVTLPIVVVDNASTDRTAEAVRAAGRAAASFAEVAGADMGTGAATQLTLVHAPGNLGFAGGVNIGLRHLMARPGVELFWLVNPDCIAGPGAAAAYLAAGQGGDFALMAGRTLFASDEGIIQSDGGRVSRLTAVCRNVNRGRGIGDARPPDPATLDFLSGANLVASRRFIEQAGSMREDYFLFYEEVDWAFRRGRLALRLCPEALVRHHGGTATGAGTLGRRPSALANYFNYRSRVRFAWRHMPWALPGAYLHSLAKIAQLWLSGARPEALGAFRGLMRLAPPRPAGRGASSPPVSHGARSGIS